MVEVLAFATCRRIWYGGRHATTLVWLNSRVALFNRRRVNTLGPVIIITIRFKTHCPLVHPWIQSCLPCRLWFDPWFRSRSRRVSIYLRWSLPATLYSEAQWTQALILLHISPSSSLPRVYQSPSHLLPASAAYGRPPVCVHTSIGSAADGLTRFRNLV